MDEFSISVNDIEIQEYEQAYETLSFECKLHNPEDFEEPLIYICEGKNNGTPLPFDERVSFKRGEVTVWASSNGSGKSLLIGQIVMQLCQQGIKSSILSFEMSPERTLYRMMRQRLGHKPSGKEVPAFLDTIRGKFKLLNYKGAIHENIVFGTVVVSARKYGCEHIFIDNLMKVVAGEDDYNSQKSFVEQCTNLARLLDVHIHIIHHTRKGQNEEDELNKYSIKGSGAIIDLADNAILIQRNRKKEKDRESGNLSPMKDIEEADSILRVVKQRNGDFEGAIGLWFDPESTGFCKGAERVPLFFEGAKNDN